MWFIMLVLFPLMTVTAVVAVVGFRRGAGARRRALAQVCLGIAIVLGATIRTILDSETVYGSFDWWITTTESVVGIAIAVPQLVRIATVGVRENVGATRDRLKTKEAQDKWQP